MKSSYIAALVVGLLLLVGIILFVVTGSEEETVNTNITAPQSQELQTQPIEEQTTPAENEATTQQTYTLQEISIHNSASDCWTVINGSVYDITSYLGRHPGGDAIELACGTDGTSLFTQRETSDGEQIGSGTPHSSSASRQLEALKIGELVN